MPATLTIHRDETLLDVLRDYRILLDGTEIGRVGRGGTLNREIAAGEHVLEARIDWCGSRAQRFVAQDGAGSVFVVRNTLRGIGVLWLAIYVLFRARDYLTLEPAPERREPT